MAEPRITQEMKRHALIVSLAAGHSDFKMGAFLNVAMSFVFKVRRELDAASGDVATVSHKKRHCHRLVIIKTPAFISSVQAAIDEDHGQSIRAIGRHCRLMRQPTDVWFMETSVTSRT